MLQKGRMLPALRRVGGLDQTLQGAASPQRAGIMRFAVPAVRQKWAPPQSSGSLSGLFTTHTQQAGWPPDKIPC